MTDRIQLAEFDEDFSTVLCVAAHPDDIEYGTAAAVDRWTKAGKTVTYFLLTRGEAGIDTMEPGKAGPLRGRRSVMALRSSASARSTSRATPTG